MVFSIKVFDAVKIRIEDEKCVVEVVFVVV